jgi:hypothetical protein
MVMTVTMTATLAQYGGDCPGFCQRHGHRHSHRSGRYHPKIGLDGDPSLGLSPEPDLAGRAPASAALTKAVMIGVPHARERVAKCAVGAGCRCREPWRPLQAGDLTDPKVIYLAPLPSGSAVAASTLTTEGLPAQMLGVAGAASGGVGRGRRPVYGAVAFKP